MKKLLFILLVAGIFSCDSNKKVDVEETESTQEIQPGIQNVNGNIPDTSNSISLDNNKTDSGVVNKDSLRK